MPIRSLDLRGRHGSLARGVFAANAALLVATMLVLVLTPLTVSFPVVLTEAVLLAGLLGVTLVVELWLLRRAFAPLARFRDAIRAIDPRHPPRRLELESAAGEVGELVGAFNRMLERVDDERRARLEQAVASQEAERQRIARELHDEIGQQLTAVLLHLGRLHGELPQELRGPFEEAQQSARASLDDVRRVAQQLRPGALDDLGLRQAIAELCVSLERGSGFRVVRRLATGLPSLDARAELVIYRVAQEALTNVARHAGASVVEVEVAVELGAVRLEVRDDGIGIGDAAAGAGLRGMMERAELIGAAIEVESAAGAGTTVRLLVGAEPSP